MILTMVRLLLLYLMSVANSVAPRSWHMTPIISCSLRLQPTPAVMLLQ